jgi:hypothetical protein
MAHSVGLKIKRAKTEFMMGGNWASPIVLRVSTGTINLVKDFRACVESTLLLYNAVPWTSTDSLSRKLDGCYTKLLRHALND